MDDLKNALQALLADPQQLSELSALAASLGMAPPQPEPAKPPDAPAPPPPETGPPMPPPFPDNRREKLLLSLKPFLKPGRQQKLDRALHLARLLRLATTALGHPD